MSMNRREFGKTMAAVGGAAVGAAAALPVLGEMAVAQHLPRPAGAMVQLDSNENPYGPSAEARAAITASEPICCRYPDVNEHAMVERLSDFYQVPESMIMLGCGSTEVLRCADMAFLGKGKGALAAEPTFETVLGFAKVMQADPIKVPLTADHRHDLPAMLKAGGYNTGLVYICNPNNPTGTIVSRDELNQFMDQVPRHIPVLVDEAYYDFVTDPSYATVVPWLKQYPNLIVARTFSKVYGMAGMRLGYALGNQPYIADMRKYKLGMNANVAALRAALASFEDERHVADQRQKMIAARTWLEGELKRDGRTYIPSHANFLMIDLKTDVQPVIGAFRQRGVLVGRKFPSMPTWLRITVGKPEEMQTFMAGLRAIVPSRA